MKNEKTIKLEVSHQEITAALSVLARVEEYQEKLATALGNVIENTESEAVSKCLERMAGKEWARAHTALDAQNLLESLSENMDGEEDQDEAIAEAETRAVLGGDA